MVTVMPPPGGRGLSGGTVGRSWDADRLRVRAVGRRLMVLLYSGRGGVGCNRRSNRFSTVGTLCHQLSKSALGSRWPVAVPLDGITAIIGRRTVESPDRSLVPSKIKQDENAERAAIRAVSFLKLPDGGLRLPNDLHDFGPYKVLKGIVVGEMAMALHLHELVSEVLNRLWELLKHTLRAPIGALPLDLSMVQ